MMENFNCLIYSWKVPDSDTDIWIVSGIGWINVHILSRNFYSNILTNGMQWFIVRFNVELLVTVAALRF